MFDIALEIQNISTIFKKKIAAETLSFDCKII